MHTSHTPANSMARFVLSDRYINVMNFNKTLSAFCSNNFRCFFFLFNGCKCLFSRNKFLAIIEINAGSMIEWLRKIDERQNK